MKRAKPQIIACLAGVKRGRERGNLGAREIEERNGCKDAVVFSIFHAQILSVKTVIGQNQFFGGMDHYFFVKFGKYTKSMLMNRSVFD